MHFFVSRERYAINTGFIKRQLDEIANHLKDSETHNFENYYFDYIQGFDDESRENKSSDPVRGYLSFL